MSNIHISNKEGIYCSEAGNMKLNYWRGIGLVYDSGLSQCLIKNETCPECGESISTLLQNRGTNNEQLALDLMSDDIENGC